MKKLFVFFIIVITSLGLVEGQINMSSTGNVGIGGAPNSVWSLMVNNPTTNHGIAINNLGTITYGTRYGLSSTFGNSTTGSVNRAISGSVYSSIPSTSGQAYGVYGIAGNCTNGYNAGVIGQLLGTNSGASVIGVIGAYYAPSDLTVAGTQYAGYFLGNVKITGSIWAASGTITGSDERIKKEITILDSSDNIFNLKPKQYKLKTQKELFSGQKMTSDTAKVVVDNRPDSENDTKYHYGFLAQELQLVYPDLVYASADGSLGIDYQGLIPMIIDQLQKMKTSLNEKDNRIIALEDGLEKCCSLSRLKSASIDNNPNSSLTLPENASLSQNAPNPFNATTTIAFYIPETVQNAIIYIYDMNGKQIKSYPISNHGSDSLTINGFEFKPGMYLYTLIADGKEIDTKRMILTE